MEAILNRLPNELWMEIFSYTEEPFDLVEDSVTMDKVLIKSILTQVSRGMKSVSLFLDDPSKKKFSKAQWATLFAHRGYVPLLKVLAAKNYTFDAWLYQVAVDAGQTEAASYLQPSNNTHPTSQWKSDVQLIMEQTGLPKWQCFEANRRNAGDIVSAIMDLTS